MSGEKELKVLIVGSESDMRSSLAALLRTEGYQTTETRDGHSAYDAITASFRQTGQAGWHLVIVDTQQPSDDALILLQELRAAGLRRLPLLVVSAAVSYEDVELVALQKPAGILLKPFGREDLIQKLGQLLGLAAPAS